MAKVHSSLATTELHNPKGMGVESATEELLTMSASIGAVSASASMVPHTTDVFSLGTDSLRWTNVIASGNVSSSLVSTGSFGRLELAGNANVDGTLTIAGGTTTLGDSDSDTLVITADLASNLIPDADNTRDIGSTAASWKNIHADGTGSFKNIITSHRLYLHDGGGEYIDGDGTDLNFYSSADINIPANVGLTFGNDGEKIEGDGTDLTIAGNNINLTGTADIKVPANVGVMFGTHEKIESDDTDLNISVGSSGDINIPANIGLTFGDDGEKIEGDGTDLTIAGNNINLTAAADVKVPVNIGVMFGTHEKIESDDTDLNLTVGSGGDINIPANIGLTFGDDGEKIEGDGTDLTISGAKINLAAGTDVHIPKNKGIVFDDNSSEKIESNDTDLTINSGADINLTATADVNIPANVGITFGDDGEKIEGDGTDLTIAANILKITSAMTSGSSVSTGSFAHAYFKNNVGINELAPGEALEVVGNVSGSGTGSFHHSLTRQRAYLFDTGGEFLSSDGTDLTIAAGADLNLTATTDINVPSAVGLTFGDDGEKIEGDGTDLTIASSAKLNLAATSDVHIPQNIGLVFDANASEKIESDDTDLTINSGAKINLTAVSDVHIPNDVGIVFGGASEKIEGDGTDLTIAGAKINLIPATDIHVPKNKGIVFDDNGSEKIESNDTDLTINSGADINLTATTDINVPANVGLTFGDDGEKIEGNGTDLTIAGNNINLTAAADVIIPTNIGLHFTDANEKIESDGTDLTINSGADINLTATADVNIPASIGLTFGADTEKIEADGSNNLSVISNGNTIIETVTFNNGDVTIPGDLTVTGDKIQASVGNLQVADHTITVGSGSESSALMHNGGIDWGVSGSVAFLRYRHAGTAISSSVFVEAPKLIVDTITLDAAEIDASGALTIDTGADLTLDATGDINVPANIGMTFGDDGEKIEGDGTDLTIASSAKLNLNCYFVMFYIPTRRWYSVWCEC